LPTAPLRNRIPARGTSAARSASPSSRRKETNNDITYGAGLQYDLTRQVGVSGEWQRYNKMGGGSIAETKVDVLSVGVLYRFQ